MEFTVKVKTSPLLYVPEFRPPVLLNSQGAFQDPETMSWWFFLLKVTWTISPAATLSRLLGTYSTASEVVTLWTVWAKTELARTRVEARVILDCILEC